MSNPTIKTAGKPAKNRSKKSLSEKTVERINRGVDVFGLKRPAPAPTTKKELPSKQTVDAVLKAVKDALTKPSKVTTSVAQDGSVIVKTGIEIRIVNTVTEGFHFEIKNPTTFIPGNRKSPLEKFLETVPGGGKALPSYDHSQHFVMRELLGRLAGKDYHHTETGRIRSPFPVEFAPISVPVHSSGELQREEALNTLGLSREMERIHAAEEAERDAALSAGPSSVKSRRRRKTQA